jgi:hypothetical protein
MSEFIREETAVSFVLARINDAAERMPLLNAKGDISCKEHTTQLSKPQSPLTMPVT